MAITFKVRVCDLFPEFLADTLVILGAAQPARTVTAGPFQAIPDGLDHFLVFIHFLYEKIIAPKVTVCQAAEVLCFPFFPFGEKGDILIKML